MYILNAPSYFQNGVSETGAELHVPPIDEPCPLQSPKHLMDLGQGLVNGIVHKVEGTIVDMFKGGTPTLTKFQANKVFQVTVQNLGMTCSMGPAAAATRAMTMVASSALALQQHRGSLSS